MKKILFVFSVLLAVLSFLSQDSGEKELHLVSSGPRMNGPEVIRLQKFLVYNGYYIGKDGIDGWFGTDTDTALRQYQKAEKLPVTGRIRVSDVPEKLEWNFELRKWDRNERPNATTEPQQEIKEGLLKTYYGTKQISFTEDDIHYRDFLLSPNSRFLYYEAYIMGGGEDPQHGHTHFVEDLLTGDKFVSSGLSAMYDVNSTEYESVYDRCSGSYIADVFWTGDGDLYFVAHVLFHDQPEKEQAFLLNVEFKK